MNGIELKELRIKKGLTQTQLAEITGIPQGTIGRLESTGQDIKKVDVLTKLIAVFKNESDPTPKASKTSMVLSDLTPHKGYSTTPTKNTENKGVPYYDIDFMGGFDMVFNDQTIAPSFYIDFLPFNDCDCWINVTGKSMGPLIAHGDIVGLKKVADWQRFLLEGEIYAVVTDNGFRTIKMLGAGPDKSTYTLIPYNKSEEYKPQVIPKEVITHIFRVKGNIKKFF